MSCLIYLKNNLFSTLLLILFSVVILVYPFVASAQAGGLIPCSGNDCGTCHIVELADNVIEIIIALALGISVIIFILQYTFPVCIYIFNFEMLHVRVPISSYFF